MHKHSWNSFSLKCMQGGKLTWTAGVPLSCVSWRRTSRPVCLSCGSIPARSLLCGGRTPAGPVAAGYETRIAAPSIWTVPPAGYGSLFIKREYMNGMSQLFTLLSQHCTHCPSQKMSSKYPELSSYKVYYVIICSKRAFFSGIYPFIFISRCKMLSAVTLSETFINRQSWLSNTYRLL